MLNWILYLTHQWRNPMRKLISCLLGAVCIISSSLLTQTVHADDDPVLKAIKARQAGFQLYSFYAGHLFAMAKGEMEYDAELASTMAQNLNTVANLSNGAMWPQGSDNEAYAGKTRALPEIWTTYPAIGEKSQALKDATAAMVEVAGNGLDALRSKIGAVGQSCKGCHDDFRAEDF